MQDVIFHVVLLALPAITQYLLCQVNLCHFPCGIRRLVLVWVLLLGEHDVCQPDEPLSITPVSKEPSLLLQYDVEYRRYSPSYCSAIVYSCTIRLKKVGCLSRGCTLWDSNRSNSGSRRVGSNNGIAIVVACCGASISGNSTIVIVIIIPWP